jgi:quinol monooxygenase YgiN
VRTCITRLAACAFGLLSLSAAASAGDDRAIYDITHFDVLPVTSPFDSEQIAYPALFEYRDASQGDFGNQSFRIVNWLVATNHSFIVDVWKNQRAFEAHLAQPHSVAFRFAVQDLPVPDLLCCIGSPIDDRQYTLVSQFATPWTSSQLPTTVPNTPGTGAIFVIIYVDFLVDGDPNKGQDQLISYGAVTANANRQHLLNFTVLQQLDRPNRYVLLQVWDTEANYNSWGFNPVTGDTGSPVTTKFVSRITPLLGSPLDYRLNSLCGETYVDGTGCTPP